MLPGKITSFTEKEPGKLLWSAPFDVPSIGDRVRVTLNGIGTGKVVRYFLEISGGWDTGYYVVLGVKVELDKEGLAPWLVKQNPEMNFVYVYGAEIDQI